MPDLMFIPSLGQILFAKYTPSAMAVLLLWDHCLTLDEEVATMWRPLNPQVLTKPVYIVNRYFIEAVMLYTAYVFAGLRGEDANILRKNVLVTPSLFNCFVFVMMRAYRLWDHKPTVRRVLAFVFVACITGAFVLSVMTALTFLKTQIELPPKVIVCAVTGVPKTIPSTIGILLSFNVFVISISFYNALENPHRYESEVFDSLRRDGSRVYLLISLLYVPSLIASLVADILVFFPILILASSLKVNLTARMHLRIENLSLSDSLRPVAIYPGHESY